MTEATTPPQTGLKPGAAQYRIHRDANKAIPLNRVTKTQFIHDAVQRAMDNPSVLAQGLMTRVQRSPSSTVDRVSISVNTRFKDNLQVLSDAFRLTSEEVVRLCVEAAVFPMSSQQLVAVVEDVVGANLDAQQSLGGD